MTLPFIKLVNVVVGVIVQSTFMTFLMVQANNLLTKNAETMLRALFMYRFVVGNL